MKHHRWRRAYWKVYAQLLISINERFEDFGVNESLYFLHLSWGQHCGDRTFHVAISFPLRLILKESRLNLLAFADVCCGAGIARREPRIGVVGQREIPMNNYWRPISENAESRQNRGLFQILAQNRNYKGQRQKDNSEALRNTESDSIHSPNFSELYYIEDFLVLRGDRRPRHAELPEPSAARVLHWLPASG